MEEVRTCVFCDAKVTEWAARTFLAGGRGGGRVYGYAAQCVCNSCANKHLEYKTRYGSYQLKRGRVAPPSVL